MRLPRPDQTAPRIDFATLDLLPYGVIVTDQDGVVLYYNKREEQIAGRSRGEVIGRNFFTEIAPCTQVTQFRNRFDDATSSGVTNTFAFLFPFPGSPREVEISLTGFNYDGNRLCMISVNDKTEQEQVRADILAAERFRELGEVAATVAHNFNNLLMIVQGNASLMLED